MKGNLNGSIRARLKTDASLLVTVAAVIGLGFAFWNSISSLAWSAPYRFHVELASEGRLESYYGQLALLEKMRARARRENNWDMVRQLTVDIKKLEDRIIRVKGWAKKYR